MESARQGELKEYKDLPDGPQGALAAWSPRRKEMQPRRDVDGGGQSRAVAARAVHAGAAAPQPRRPRRPNFGCRVGPYGPSGQCKTGPVTPAGLRRRKSRSLGGAVRARTGQLPNHAEVNFFQSDARALLHAARCCLSAATHGVSLVKVPRKKITRRFLIYGRRCHLVRA